jgi:hypothetical protein
VRKLALSPPDDGCSIGDVIGLFAQDVGREDPVVGGRTGKLIESLFILRGLSTTDWLRRCADLIGDLIGDAGICGLSTLFLLDGLPGKCSAGGGRLVVPFIVKTVSTAIEFGLCFLDRSGRDAA